MKSRARRRRAASASLVVAGQPGRQVAGRAQQAGDQTAPAPKGLRGAGCPPGQRQHRLGEGREGIPREHPPVQVAQVRHRRFHHVARQRDRDVIRIVQDRALWTRRVEQDGVARGQEALGAGSARQHAARAQHLQVDVLERVAPDARRFALVDGAGDLAVEQEQPGGATDPHGGLEVVADPRDRRADRVEVVVGREAVRRISRQRALGQRTLGQRLLGGASWRKTASPTAVRSAFEASTGGLRCSGGGGRRSDDPARIAHSGRSAPALQAGSGTREGRRHTTCS